MENPNQKPSVQWILISIIIVSLIIGAAILYANKSNNQGNTNVNGQFQETINISKIKTDGEPFYGNANAPVVMAYWFDYQCPFCQKNEQQLMPQIIRDYVDTNKVKIVFKDYEFLGADSQTIGKFARAVWEATPDKFYQWHKAMIDNQGQENSGWATQDKIMSITTQTLGADDANKVLALVEKNSNKYQEALDADKQEAASLGITGTPTAIIGNQLIVGAQPYDTFKSAIDKALNGKI